MQKYLLTILIRSDLDVKDRTAIIDDVKKNLGDIKKEDLWGIRSLSYDIKHLNKAFYAYFEFETEPKSIITLDKNIRLNEDIIRYLIIKTEVKRQKSKGKSTSENSKVEEKEAEITIEKEVEVSKVAPEAAKEKNVRSRKK